MIFYENYETDGRSCLENACPCYPISEPTIKFPIVFNDGQSGLGFQ